MKHLIGPMERIFKEKNKINFHIILSEVHWDMELENNNVDEAMLAFNKKLSIADRNSFPSVKMSIKRSRDK